MKKIITLLAVFSISLCAVQTANAEVSATPLSVNQWIQSSDDGTLSGHIMIPAENGTSVAVADATVAIRDTTGKIHNAVAKTNSKGEFTFTDVQPGVYSLTARADYVFAVCAMHVVDNRLVGEREFPRSIEIMAANVDYTTIKTAVIRYMPPATNVNTNVSIKDAKLDSLVSRVCQDDAYRVNQYRGGMKGRLLKAGTQGADLQNVHLTNVFIMKDGVEIARTVTNESGEFEIGSIPAGNYSLMAVGPDGLGLVGFELVDQTSKTAMTTAHGKTLIQSPCCCNEFSMQVAPVENVETVLSDTVISEQPIMGGSEIIADGTVIDGGGFVGGGGGFASSGTGFTGGAAAGGGGLLGGSRLGTIAGLAGIGGAIAIAVSDDDDDNFTPAPVASPVTPN